MAKRPKLPAFCMDQVHEAAAKSDEPQSRGAAHCDAMTQVLEHLYLGSWRDSADEKLMDAHGITHVLDCAKENEARPTCGGSSEECETSVAFPRQPSTRMNRIMKRIELIDAHSQDIECHLQEACEFIEEALHAQGKVLVHCRRGLSRSPAMVIGYLMRKERLSYEDAHALVKAKRHTISPNMAFSEFLSCYRAPAINITHHWARELSETSSHTSSQTHSTGGPSQAQAAAMPLTSEGAYFPTPQDSPGSFE